MQHSNEKLSRPHVGKDRNVCSRARKLCPFIGPRYTGAEKCRPVPPIVWLSGRLENRNYSRQFGSHLGSGRLSLPLLGNCGAADAAWPAGVTPGRYLAMTVGSRYSMALSGRRVQTSFIPKSGIPK